MSESDEAAGIWKSMLGFQQQPRNDFATFLLSKKPSVAYSSGLSPSIRNHGSSRNLLNPRTRAWDASMSTIPDGANVVVFGNGAMECLTGRLAAVRGFKVTQLVAGDLNEAKSLCFDETYHPEGSIPLKLVPLTGPEATNEPIDEAVMNADALIVTFDDQRSVLSEKQLNVIMPTDSKIKHISLMSRYLNGAGMGFFCERSSSDQQP